MHLVQTMAYAGEKPWHGLGNKLARQQPIEVWKKQAGMDWKIEESDVRYITGGGPVGSIHAFPEQKVLYRSDNRTPLSVKSSGWGAWPKHQTVSLPPSRHSDQIGTRAAFSEAPYAPSAALSPGNTRPSGWGAACVTATISPIA